MDENKVFRHLKLGKRSENAIFGKKLEF